MSHLLVRPLGTGPQGEVWTFGLRYTQGGDQESDPVTPAQLQQMATDVALSFGGAGMPAGVQNCLSSSLGIRGYRVEQYITVPDGPIFKAELTGAAEALYAGVQPGAQNPARPAQIAMVVTLNNGAQYGRTGRGRIYIPAVAFPGMTAQLRFATTAGGDGIPAILAAVNDMQEAWGDAINAAAVSVPPHELTVFSRKLGTFRPVDNMSIGDVPDTQRRRRDAWTEQRTTVARA